jgi:hypothetical protein
MSDSASPNIDFRLPGDTRRLLEAVAYADLVAKRPGAGPSDVNLSAFVRDILEDVTNDFADHAGGTETLLANYRVGQVRQLEAELARMKELHDRDLRLDQEAKVTEQRQTRVKP